jgi:hypothetical protein
MRESQGDISSAPLELGPVRIGMRAAMLKYDLLALRGALLSGESMFATGGPGSDRRCRERE